MKKQVLYLLLLWFLNFSVSAKWIEVLDVIEDYIADMLEHYMAEAEVELDVDNYLEELMYLHEEPLNLNQVEREDLQQLVFLSDFQIENLMYYRYKAGEFLTIYELMLVEGLDMTDIRRILPFVEVGDKEKTRDKIKLKSAIKYGKYEVLSRMDYIPEEKKGFRKNDMGEAAYLGDRLYNHIKCRYRYKDRIYFNLTAEKDAGEQFWGDYNKLYDFWSASLQLKDIGKIQNLIVGDYQVNFGQGLVISQAFKTGKSAMATNICDMNSGFKRYGSTNEFNYMRGVAATFRWHNFRLHGFYSLDKKDGNMQDDVFTGFYQTGFHRTLSEIAKKNLITQQVMGCNVNYHGAWYKLGFSSFFMYLDKPLQPKLAPYNLHYFSGQHQWVNGIDYRLRWRKINFFGEFALDDWKHGTWLSGASFAPISRVSLAVLYRNFSPQYSAFYANSFGEGSGSRNESGMYIGAEISPIKNIKLSCYADGYRFPWLRYGVDAPSNGKDFLMQMIYTPYRKFQLNLRLRHKTAQQTKKTDNEALPQKITNEKTALRLQSNYETGIFRFRQQLDGNIIQRSTGDFSYGFSALQDIGLQFKKLPLRLDFSYAFFDAENYDNRMYVFERDVLFAFSVPSLSGIGSRYYLNLRYDISKKLSCWMKFSQTVYSDGRDEVGSSNESVIGNRKSEIRGILRYKF